MKFVVSLRAEILTYSIAMPLILVAIELVGARLFPQFSEYVYIKSLILATLFLIGIWSAEDFKIDLRGFFLVFLPSTISVFMISLFAFMIAPETTGRILYRTLSAGGLLIFGVYIYILLLTSNILFRSLTQLIPLVKAARTAMYVISLVTLFVSYIIALSFGSQIHWALSLGIIFVITLFYSIINLWFSELSNKESNRMSILLAITILFFAFVLINWPLDAAFISLALTIFVYIVIGAIFNVLNGTFRRENWVEFVSLSLVVIFVLLRFSDWGINKIPVVQ